MVMIDHQSTQPYYVQLVAGLKQDIQHGLLQPHDQLPSVRAMAKANLLNPNTVAKAYKQLEAEQVIHTVPGKGTYINVTDPQLAQQEVQQQLKQLVTQASQAGIPVRTLIEWLAQMDEGDAV